MSAGVSRYFALSIFCIIFCVNVSGTVSPESRTILSTSFTESGSEDVTAAPVMEADDAEQKSTELVTEKQDEVK